MGENAVLTSTDQIALGVSLHPLKANSQKLRSIGAVSQFGVSVFLYLTLVTLRRTQILLEVKSNHFKVFSHEQTSKREEKH